MKPIFIVVLLILSAQLFSQSESKYHSIASASKMNVLYLGIENPVEIMVAGVAEDKVNVTITNGTITKNGSYSYLVIPKSIGTVTIIVSVESGGKMAVAGKHEFRVKKVSDPVPTIAGMKGGEISKTVLREQKGIVVVIENFDYDIHFEVTEYTVSVNLTGFVESLKITGSNFTQPVLDLIEKCPVGTKILFEDIKAKGPDGMLRHLGAISFKLQ